MVPRMRVLPGLMLLACATLAQAQVGLPPLRLPQLPGSLPELPATLPLDTDKSAALLAREGEVARLTQLRALRIRELLRRHRDVLEADPHGQPVVRGEVLALSPSDAALQAAAAAGFVVLRERALDDVGLRVVVLHSSGATARALTRLQRLDPEGVYDFNHVYTDSGITAAATPAGEPASLAGSAAGAAQPQLRLGLIDSGVDATHEVFAGVPLRQHGCDAPRPAAHGTAVASLLVGRSASLRGAAPGAALYAADVFCGVPTGGAVEAAAEAFAWLLHEQVPVINVSLVGPPNRLLETVVRTVLARGCLIVAAVGNDGPAAPPLYPAAWPGVIGVTAVDARQRVLLEAGRGAQVRFAAPGADLAAARLAGGYELVRGTSFAAPLVAGLLARGLPHPDVALAQEAVASLARAAVDLGAAGVDPVYGYGLVGAELRRQPALARLGVE